MSAIQTVPRDAGERFEEAIGFAFDDALQRRLRYHLLRLTVDGLDREEVPLIVDLARRTFENADVTEEVAAISERPGVSALATAIAGVVERSHPGDATFAPRAEVLIGAVVGAYAGLVDAGNPDATEATKGDGGAIVTRSPNLSFPDCTSPDSGSLIITKTIRLMY